MLLRVTFLILIADAVFSDSFTFPDQLAARASSYVNTNGNNYGPPGNQAYNYGRQQPAFGGYHSGYPGGYVPGSNNFGHNNGGYQGYPSDGMSFSNANAQSTNFGSQANAQSGSQYYNGGSQSNAQAQSQGNGAASASASSGASGFGGSSSAAASAASSGFSGGSSAAASASSGSSFRPWFFNSRIAGEEGDSDAVEVNATTIAAVSKQVDDKLIFAE